MRKTRLIITASLAAIALAQPIIANAGAGGSFSRGGSSSRSSGYTAPSRPASAYSPSSNRQGSLTYQSQGSRGSRTNEQVAGAQRITRSTNAPVAPISRSPDTPAAGAPRFAQSSPRQETAPASAPLQLSPSTTARLREQNRHVSPVAGATPAMGFGASQQARPSGMSSGAAATAGLAGVGSAVGAGAANATSFTQRHPIWTGIAAGAGGAWLYNSIFGGNSSPAVSTNHSPIPNTLASQNLGNSVGGAALDNLATPSSAGPSGFTPITPAKDSVASAPESKGGNTFLTVMLVVMLCLGVVGALVAFASRASRRAPNSLSPTSKPAAANGKTETAASSISSDYKVSSSDEAVFVALLEQIQDAWSNGDTRALASFATTEMVSYFKESLDGNASQKVRNVVDDVRDVKVSIKESWREGRVVYVTCGLKWLAVDYVVDTTKQAGEYGYLVSGDVRVPVPMQEIWTFARHDEGDWILSAIQQIEK